MRFATMANLSHLPEQWRKSGLTQREFCDQQGISLPTFSYWRAKELRGDLDPKPTTQGVGFTQLVLQDALADRCIEIEYPSGAIIRIPL